MWQRKNKVGAKHIRALVDEAERIVAGRTLQSYILQGRRVPAWSLVAVLGHASRVELLQLAWPFSTPDPVGWSGALACLAGEMIALTDDERDLLHLQRQALIPLELDLLGGRIRAPGTSADLYVLVSGALEQLLYPEP